MLTLKEKLQDKYQIDANGCWIWTRYKDRSSYGIIKINNKNYRAHRISYEAYNGSIPQGMLVCHSCDIPSCINPQHLWLGTAKDNMQDMIKKGRKVVGYSKKKYCKHGHEFNEDNTYICKSGYRQCRACTNIRVKNIKKKTQASPPESSSYESPKSSLT